jgi:glutathione S-transferase
MALTFYHGHGSPYSWRAWLALEAKGVAYELQVLSFTAGDTKKPQFVALNPRHQVPTLVDDGFALWESIAILEYLDERFPTGSKLYPGDAQARARIRRLVCEAAEYVGTEAIDPITTEYFGKDGAEPDQEKLDKAKARLGEELEYFARELRGKFLAGDALSAADLVLYPWIGYVKRITARRAESKLIELVPEALGQWAKRIEALPYFDKTFPPHWR